MIKLPDNYSEHKIQRYSFDFWDELYGYV